MEKLLLETTHSNGFDKEEKYEIYLQMPEGELSIDVDGKTISKYRNSEILVKVFSDAIDIDSWKHSWHLKVNDFLNKEVRDEIQKILIDKQKKREVEIKYLIEVERVLMTQKVYILKPEEEIENI